MIDDPGRETPRFPADKETSAIKAVLSAVDQLLQYNDANPHGFAGGACGGDIIFHEVCLLRNIPSTILLALQPDEFISRSVSFAGGDWVARFEKICSLLPLLVLPGDVTREHQKDLSIWERTNEWIVETALNFSSSPCSLITIWDGSGGDGPGGTKHMVEEIADRHQKTIIIDPANLHSHNL